MLRPAAPLVMMLVSTCLAGRLEFQDGTDHFEPMVAMFCPEGEQADAFYNKYLAESGAWMTDTKPQATCSKEIIHSISALLLCIVLLFFIVFIMLHSILACILQIVGIRRKDRYRKPPVERITLYLFLSHSISFHIKKQFLFIYHNVNSRGFRVVI